ncbi:MAG TPA: NAD(P)-dependent oxidoreductase [Bryobacteraceae bacterium]|nr:NAD(P)-dependent oxidoreductase [Bryobacteraceae bacterium]
MSAAALPVPRNLEQFPELNPPLDRQAALAEANRCLYCYDAPCTAACPTHIDVPRFIKKIASGNLRGSALTILDSNILGLSCSRVCPVEVLCEGSCVMHQYNRRPIEIGKLQRHAMDWFYANGAGLGAALGAEGRRPASRIACIGGGPASLACAAELRRRGTSVTVFDDRPLPGGLNTYGVAEYKLRASDSLQEVDLIRSLGVEFRRAEVGITVSLDDLEKEFDLIFIGMGLGAMERLGIPGENRPEVVDALRFIAHYKTAHDVQVGRIVAVIGGGNTAIDAANAARRLGAEEVHVFYRRTEKEMPAFAFEYEHAKVEGVQFHWMAQPVEILDRAVKFVSTRLGAPDARGRRKAEPIAGTEFAFVCDMVIPAVGQSRLMKVLHETRGIQLDGGLVAIDRPTGGTANEKYFAGGDCVNGGREVVDAVADGKRAALAMAQRLETRHG